MNRHSWYLIRIWEQVVLTESGNSSPSSKVLRWTSMLGSTSESQIWSHLRLHCKRYSSKSQSMKLSGPICSYCSLYWSFYASVALASCSPWNASVGEFQRLTQLIQSRTIRKCSEDRENSLPRGLSNGVFKLIIKKRERASCIDPWLTSTLNSFQFSSSRKTIKILMNLTLLSASFVWRHLKMEAKSGKFLPADTFSMVTALWSGFQHSSSRTLKSVQCVILISL